VCVNWARVAITPSREVASAFSLRKRPSGDWIIGHKGQGRIEQCEAQKPATSGSVTSCKDGVANVRSAAAMLH
jgi:hypothetical protein